MGDKTQLKNMINRCRTNGIRIYSEVVINHMCINGNDMYEKHIDSNNYEWGPKSGSAGSPFWTTRGITEEINSYTGLKKVLEFPAVPYFASDFHCYKEIINIYNADEWNYGWIYPYFIDLNTEKEYVQQRISDFLTELIIIGISGFSINSAKFVSPSNYISIFKKLKNNLGGELPRDFISYFQFNFLDEDEKQLILCNYTNNYSFSQYFYKEMKKENFSDNDINKIKLWSSGYTRNVFPECDNNWEISKERYIIALDNQDIQRPDAYDSYLKYKNLEDNKNKNIEMLNDMNANWTIKIIFSSYSLMNSGGKGFPDGKSDCKKCKNELCKKECTKSVPYQKAYNPLSIGYDSGDENNWKEGTYTRIHRNIDIVNAMREWMEFEPFTENKLYEKEKLKGECKENCLICNEESNKLNKCIYCNIDKGYYPIFNGNIYERYHECIYNDSNLEKFYFDSENNYFKPCYETCKTCNREGNETDHNCLTCNTNYIFRPDELNKHNCVLNCTYPHYFSSYGQYQCSDKPQCPKEISLFIKEKNECVNDCKKDNIYKYQYNGICLKECPNNTYNNTFLCEDIYIEDKCALSNNAIEFKNYNEIIENIVKSYSEEFSYTDNHLSQYKNSEYNIIIYKNSNCIKELSLNMPTIDFGNCYSKIKNHYSINDSLIIVTIDKFNQDNPYTTNSFFNPITKEKLNVEGICEDEKIIPINLTE